MRIGRYSDAVVVAREILAEDPQNFAVLELLAKALWQGGMMDEVVEVTRRLIVINPYEPGYHSLQAAALQCLGRYGESARAYERAGNEPGAREALADLNKWQACLVSEIMQTDPVFRAQYEQNAAFATAARGFSFCETEEKDDLWIVSGERRESLYTRPS